MKFCYRAALVALAFAAAVFGQGTPAPFAVPQYFLPTGLPNAGGSICTYLSFTTTPAITYSNAALTVPNATCVLLNSGGYPASGGIWMVASLTYRFVELSAVSVTIFTIDGVPGSGSGALPNGALLWSLTGSTVSNTPATKVCVSTTTCTAALALLNIAGSSSGTNFLERIDDASNSPGINFYGSGNSMGAIEGTTTGLQLLSGDLYSQVQVASGAVLVENLNPSGATTINVKQGAAQLALNMMNFVTFGGTTIAFVDVNGGYGGAYLNATNTAAGVTFQNSNNLFSVNGYGDLTANGQVNVVGTNDGSNGGGGVAYKVNGTKVIDNVGNAFFVQGTFSSAATFNGGLATNSATNSLIYIGPGGNFYAHVLPSGPSGYSTTVNCTGVADGWTALGSDFYVVWCLGGARYRSATVSF
jgi:hypothetical protein